VEEEEVEEVEEEERERIKHTIQRGRERGSRVKVV
jgi:hypothetical protein